MSRPSDQQFCGSAEHFLNRRLFLQGGAATALGVSVGGMGTPYDQAWADELRSNKKQVLLLWLAGGSSQLETFDPKPGHSNGGPFKSIQTKVAGLRISELMPRIAQRTDQMAIIRSLDTRIGDHGGATTLMEAGRAIEPGLTYPHIGSIIAKELSQRDSKVPDFVSLYLATEGHRRPDPGFLGGRYAAMHLHKSLTPENLKRAAGVDEIEHTQREHLRQYLSDRFRRTRDARKIQGYNSTYARVKGLMASDSLFNLDDEPETVKAKYGPTDFGQHCLIGRRLIESGVPMVKVARAWWDSHSDNFESHRELVSELDYVMSVLLDDLAQRGLLENTLVVTLSEFGRTPKIKKNMGRDHFASAWSCTMTGSGIRPGALYGETTADGQQVAKDKVGASEVAATIFQAVGIDHEKHYYLRQRPIPLVPEETEPIHAVLG